MVATAKVLVGDNPFRNMVAFSLGVYSNTAREYPMSNASYFNYVCRRSVSAWEKNRRSWGMLTFGLELLYYALRALLTVPRPAAVPIWPRSFCRIIYGS